VTPGDSGLDVLVVLPTLNEVDNLEALVAALVGHGYRVLIVDDLSEDGTGELADRLAADDEGVSVIHRAGRRGYGFAAGVGFREALRQEVDVIAQMDSDFSHDPAALPELVAAIANGAEMVIGSRYVKGGSIVDWPLRRRLLSRGANRYSQLVLGLRVKDVTAGFRAFRPDALRLLEPWTCRAAGYGFLVEMAWRATRGRLEIVEVPVIFRDRVAGETKLAGPVVREAALLVTKWGVGRIFRRGRIPGWPSDDGSAELLPGDST
jgi:glycosyltransferase involved in cell wall biosynthesis